MYGKLMACQQNPQAAAEAQDPFAQLVALVMLPALRTAITNAWQAREPEALLQWLDLWHPLMPPALLHELLTSQVFPKVRHCIPCLMIRGHDARILPGGP